MSELTQLRVRSPRELSVSEARQILDRIEGAYNGLIALDVFLAAVTDEGSQPVRGRPPIPGSPRRPMTAARYVSPGQLLVLKAVRIESPGWWLFLGNVKPLENLREFINERHRRRQDREYRERIEERRGDLENILLENQVIRERIEVARSLGYPEDELRLHLDAYLFGPIEGVGVLVDRGLLEPEVDEPDAPEPKSEEQA